MSITSPSSDRNSRKSCAADVMARHFTLALFRSHAMRPWAHCVRLVGAWLTAAPALTLPVGNYGDHLNYLAGF